MLFNLCFFLSLMLITFLICLLLNKRKLKKNKKGRIGEVNYLVARFNLDKRKIDYKKITTLVSLTNAFIIAFVCTVICIIPVKLIWQMLIGFVMLFILIFLFYELIGKMCLKKGWKKNANK